MGAPRVKWLLSSTTVRTGFINVLPGGERTVAGRNCPQQLYLGSTRYFSKPWDGSEYVNTGDTEGPLCEGIPASF